MKYLVGLLILIVVVIAAVTLGMQNSQLVEFNFIIAKGTYSLPILLAVFLGIGFLCAWLLTGLFYIRLRYRYMRIQQKMKQLQKQLTKSPSVTSNYVVLPESKNATLALPSQSESKG